MHIIPLAVLSVRLMLAALLLAPVAVAAQSLPAPNLATPPASDNSTRAATTAFVRGLVGATNGLAGLDSGGRLPLAQLPAVAGGPALGVQLKTVTTPNTTLTNAMQNTMFGVATDTGYNAITGAGVTTVANTFPTGVYGYWEMPLAGGTGFSLNGICVLKATGSCFAELDARNNSGPPPAVPPGNPSFGSGDNLSIGLHLGAGGTYQPGIGLSIGADGGAPNRFVDGIYMQKDGFGPTGHGLFVDASATSGPAVSALLRNTGQGSNVPLVLQTMGTAVASNPALQHLNAAGTATWSLSQGGGGAFTAPVQAPQLTASAASFPSQAWQATGNGTDQKNADAFLDMNGNVQFRLINDAYNAANPWLAVVRSGYTPSFVVLYAPVQLKPYTVSALPTCNSGMKGSMAYVTDATAPSYNASLTGGGAVAVPAFCNGSAWTAH